MPWGLQLFHSPLFKLNSLSTAWCNVSAVLTALGNHLIKTFFNTFVITCNTATISVFIGWDCTSYKNETENETGDESKMDTSGKFYNRRNTPHEKKCLAFFFLLYVKHWPHCQQKFHWNIPRSCCVILLRLPYLKLTNLSLVIRATFFLNS